MTDRLPGRKGATQMITIYDANDGQKLGTITDEQLAFLIDQLEEESSTDTDYYINTATLDMFEAADADPGLLTLLRQALGKRREMDIRWERV
jgi:hypothetical protein